MKTCIECGNCNNLNPFKFDENYEIIYKCSFCFTQTIHLNNNQFQKNKKALNFSEKPTTHEVKNQLRDAIHYCLRGKENSLSFTIGCDSEMLRRHLKSQFLPFMSWDNKCLWHIHHIRPLNTFNFITENNCLNIEEMKKANHYTNLQPVWINEHQKIETKTKQAYNKLYET